MSRLLPIPRLATRRLKLVDHYYSPVEAFWQVSEQDHHTWAADRQLLDEAGVLRDGRWADPALPPEVDATFDRGHRSWFATAEHAFSTGQPFDHEEVDKRYYVGPRGVLAIVARPDDGPALVNCFRPDAVLPVGDRATAKYLREVKHVRPYERAAVRRRVRGASR